MPKGDFNKVARLLLQLSSLITSSALISGIYFIDEKANYNIAFLVSPSFPKLERESLSFHKIHELLLDSF